MEEFREEQIEVSCVGHLYYFLMEIDCYHKK